MGYNLSNKSGKYFCIHCKINFSEVPKFERNECKNSYQHDIVKKSEFKKILIKR